MGSLQSAILGEAVLVRKLQGACFKQQELHGIIGGPVAMQD